MKVIIDRKQKLRNLVNQQRKSLSHSTRMESARQLANIVTQIPAFVQGQHLAAYWPHRGEIDPSLILEVAHSMGKQCYLPILHPLGYPQLCFVEYHPEDCLMPNRFGILEPDPTIRTTVDMSTLSLILVPVVAFDEQGRRLGSGGGYYDRSFAPYQQKSNKPYLLGLAYEMQCVAEVPSDPLDIALDGVATETRYRTFIQENP